MSPARTATAEPLPTIWEVSDELWEIVALILADLDPPPATGRLRIDQRQHRGASRVAA